MFDVARYYYDVAHTNRCPSDRSFTRPIDLKGALQNIEKLQVFVIVERDNNSWWHRAANDAGRVPDVLRRGKEL